MNKVNSIRLLFIRDLSFFLTIPAFIWQALFLYLPLCLVIVVSMICRSEQGFGGFTLAHYAELIDPAYGLILARSFVLATVNAVVCVVLGYPVAYFLAFYVRRWKNQFLFFLILPFWISFLVQVYAWFFVLEKNGLLNSLLIKMGIITEPLALLYTPMAIYFVMLYCYLPFAVMPIYSVLEKFDKRLFEASADLGASQWQTLSRVTLPLSVEGIRTAFFLVFVPSFGEFVVPTLLGGGKQMYVGSLISHQFLLARNFNVGAAFTCASGLVLIAAAIVWYLFFKRFFAGSRRMQ
jgi:spermidine/putrescine transport system permease protein